MSNSVDWDQFFLTPKDIRQSNDHQRARTLESLARRRLDHWDPYRTNLYQGVRFQNIPLGYLVWLREHDRMGNEAHAINRWLWFHGIHSTETPGLYTDRVFPYLTADFLQGREERITAYEGDEE